MLLNHLKLAIRLLIRKPFFTFINVSGLAAGFAVFFVLWQYSTHELESDQFHTDHDRMYRIRPSFQAFNSIGQPINYQVGAYNPVFATVVKEKFAEVEQICRITNQINYDELRLKHHNTRVFFSYTDDQDQKHSFQEENTAYADTNLFSFFSIPLILGDAGSVLSDANAIVISRKSSLKYFGKENPIGKMLVLNDTIPFTVTGVFADLPQNTHLTFDMVMSSLHIRNQLAAEFPFQRGTHCYIKVRRGVFFRSLEEKIDAESKRRYQEYLRQGWPNSVLTVHLQPIADVAFSVYDNDGHVVKSRDILVLFKGVAILVLLVAFINYVNLSLTSRVMRSKEFAARKAIGAGLRDFTKQFLFETVLVNIIALLTAITLIQLTAGILMTHFHFYIPDWNSVSPSRMCWLCLVPISGILITAIFPALACCRQNTYELFKSGTVPSRKNFIPQILSGFQYLAAFTLIVWLFSINNQMTFILNRDLGLRRERVTVVDLPLHQDENFRQQLRSFQDRLNELPGVSDFAVSTSLTGDKTDNIVDLARTDITLWSNGRSDGGVDERFIPFFGLTIVAGRNFLPDQPSNHTSIIISRTMARKIGFEPEEAIGKIVRVTRVNWFDESLPAEIIGVIDDYKKSPLLKEFGVSSVNDGIILTYGNTIVVHNVPSRISIRMEAAAFDKTIPEITKLYAESFQGHLFNSYSLNDHINRHYINEALARNQIGLFTFLAIGIACVGLLGVSSLKAAQKIKEVGIRKVLGAQFRHIAALLLGTTVRQMIIAVLLGSPLAYYLIQQYLEKFSDRITVQWWHLALPAALLSCILLMTISFVLVNTANKNPVEALKCE
jgi:putative ABC transport system permease protein